jgi:hypothetical protein
MFNPFLWLIVSLFWIAIYSLVGWHGVGTVAGFCFCVMVVLFLREGANAKRG